MTELAKPSPSDRDLESQLPVNRLPSCPEEKQTRPSLSSTMVNFVRASSAVLLGGSTTPQKPSFSPPLPPTSQINDDQDSKHTGDLEAGKEEVTPSPNSGSEAEEFFTGGDPTIGSREPELTHTRSYSNDFNQGEDPNICEREEERQDEVNPEIANRQFHSRSIPGYGSSNENIAKVSLVKEIELF